MRNWSLLDWVLSAMALLSAAGLVGSLYYLTAAEPFPGPFLFLFFLILLILSLIGIRHYLLRQRRIRKQMMELEGGQRAMLSYIRVLSHEVGNPVAAMIGGLAALREQLTTSAQLRLVAQIEDSALMSRDVIRNLVVMSRRSIDQVPFEPRITNLRNTVESCFRIVQFSTPATITVNYEVDAEVPEALLCDPLRLSQILLNILGNAIKYTGIGSVDLTVKLVSRDSGRFVQFVMTDSGPGISEDRLKTIFLPYYQGAHEPAQGFSSTGLGLSLVKSMVEEMGGTIRVSSRVNVGSSFIVELPWSLVPDTPADAPILEPEPLKEQALCSHEPPTVLVAEDNAINKMLACRMLEKLGCKVSHCDDGARAIEMCSMKTYDLVLMDLQMPKINGLEATEKIIQVCSDKDMPAPRIIAMTANVVAEEKRRCLEMGMVDFLAKPIRVDGLRSCLRRHSLL